MLAEVVNIDVKSENILKYIAANCPINIFYVISIILAVLVLLIIISGIVTLRKGNSFHVGPLHYEPSAKIKELSKAYKLLKQDFEDLSAESRQKGQWLKLQFKINRDILYVRTAGDTPEQINQGLAKILEFLLPSLISILTTDKDNIVRAAVLIQDGQFLKIFKGSGYSVEGTEKLRLSLTSVAGQSFSNNKEIYIKDVTTDQMWSKNPHASKTYHTLCCSPICFNEHCYAILNVDAEKIDSFNADDRDGLKLLASSLALMFYVREAAEIALQCSKEGGFKSG